MNADDELQGLWTAVFGEPPFIRAEAAVMAEVLVGALPSAPPYELETSASPVAAPDTLDRRLPEG